MGYNTLHLRCYYTKSELKKVDIHIGLYYIRILIINQEIKKIYSLATSFCIVANNQAGSEKK